MSQKPTVGRDVHYHSYGTPGGEYKSKPIAAKVTQVSDDPDDLVIGLMIMNPTGLFFNTAVPHAPDDKPTPGHWNWPPRV